MTRLIRLYKGGAMLLLFGVWLVALTLGAPLVPLHAAWAAVRGKGASFDGWVRGYLRVWLGLLGAAGLLSGSPARGLLPPGGAVLVANHPGLFDVLFLIRDIPNLKVMAARKLSRFGLLALFMRRAGYVFSPGEEGGNAVVLMQQAARRVKEGERFLIFPEGTRSPAGGLRPFHAGAFRIARLADAPVVPVLIRNTPPFLSHEDRWYAPPAERSRLSLEIWPAWPPPKEGEERAMAKELHDRMRKALGISTD